MKNKTYGNLSIFVVLAFIISACLSVAIPAQTVDQPVAQPFSQAVVITYSK